MTEKTLGEQKFDDWGFMITHAAANLPRSYNPKTRRSELTIESSERLRGMIDDTISMTKPFCDELAKEALEKHGITIIGRLT